ncbi:MAG TPA: ACT domain-containing protein [Burkholderiaceae bacterium]|nr:ACT domain-containing protein [Burkholderiaceae bacterium]
MNDEDKNLDSLLRNMAPALRPGRYVYCTFAAAGLPPGMQTLCTYEEAEGRSAILREDEALRHGLAYKFRCALITLSVHSDLASVGFMSAVASALAELGIPCNVVSAYYHDHLFVPFDRAAEAMAALHEMSAARQDSIA